MLLMFEKCSIPFPTSLSLSLFPSLSFSLSVCPPAAREASGPRLLSGQGLGGPDISAETQRIHQENQSKLQGMSRAEILEEQKRLLTELGGCSYWWSVVEAV